MGLEGHHRRVVIVSYAALSELAKIFRLTDKGIMLLLLNQLQIFAFISERYFSNRLIALLIELFFLVAMVLRPQ